MKQLNIKSATSRYNNLMDYLCLEYLTIGTRYSESTDGWNIRDMVAECDFQLQMYFSDGRTQGAMRYDDPKQWRAEVGRLQRFIKAFLPYINNVKCKDNHCSQYDNKAC